MANDEGWMADAECSRPNVDPELFYLRKYQQALNDRKTKQAKAICHRCSVRLDCLKYSLAHNEKFGIWGGMTVHERRRYFPRKIRYMVARWWFKAHPGATPNLPAGYYAPRSPRGSRSEDIAS